MKQKIDTSLNINLWDLHVFRTFADNSNLTVSSSQLGVTQSAVSQSIARLERLFGVALIDRSCRPLRLTQAGEILKKGGNGVLQNVRRMIDEVRAAETVDLPILRLGLIDTFATTIGPDIMKFLGGRIEHLQMWSGITPTLSADLLSRKVDIIVSGDAMTAEPELTRECLLQEPLIAVVPKSQADIFKSMTMSEMCEALPLVRFSARSDLGQKVEYFLEQRRLAPRRTMEFDASEAVLRMISNGLGWTIATPLCLLHAHSSTMDLVALPLPTSRTYRRIYLIHRRNELVSVMPDVIDIFRRSIANTIVPRITDMFPWADLMAGQALNDVASHSTA
ncbi:LysR family transcriptional regulator [Rhizobiales bacterium RZME27]|uniref:LysR family transcriptional regulator n=1 Tax=Endobacterium cereale TaxID=2663029 RepID=A0A6A8A4X7_9HYPH|nr:LysR family transcriptional regulator [Endobacterium cereale]MEB2846322.1 LysR family transcriptional regulator [Endobacterium cereale]MQY46382.1 LysR family transcriptional regulator [Endobacterium cereale]